MGKPFPLAVLAALAACATVPPAARGDGIASARFGQAVSVGGTRVTPLVLLEDSRCPQAVQCVWAGQVRIEAGVGATRRELTLGRPLTVAGGSLVLAEVMPARYTATPVARADYRFGFRFERAP